MKTINSYLATLIGTIIIIGTSCTKETSNVPKNKIKEHYILSLEEPIEPDDSVYYIRIQFDNSELYYTLADSNISLQNASSSGLNTIGKGQGFRNELTEEKIQIMFYALEENPPFSIRHAIYRFGNPWENLSGANVEYYTATGEPYTYFLHMGTNDENTYFRITYYDDDRICGEFYTKLVECCGGPFAYWVNGDFMIPRIYFN